MEHGAESQLRSPSPLAVLIQGSPAREVQHTQPSLCLRVLLQVLHVPAVAVAQEGTCGRLLVHCDEWLEQNVGTSPQGWWYSSKRQAQVESTALAPSSALLCWVLWKARP